jgi:hypothetical protein
MGLVANGAYDVERHIGILPGNQHKRIYQYVHALVGRNSTAIKNALYLALPQGGVIFFPGKLLRIDPVVGRLAAIGKRWEGALGLLRDVVPHGR